MSIFKATETKVTNAQESAQEEEKTTKVFSVKRMILVVAILGLLSFLPSICDFDYFSFTIFLFIVILWVYFAVLQFYS